MKKLLLITTSILMLSTVNIKAQITLQHTIDTCWSGDRFYVTDIGNNDYKYVFLNWNTNSFSLKNMDMSPYMSNIQIPVIGNDSLANGYTVTYITKTLFDCDSTNIEFFYEYPVGSNAKPSFVYRTDGTVLFQKDSTNGPYCYGCYGGSNVWSPIINTSDGAKLFLQQWNLSTNQPQMFIYSLCGTLPTQIFDFSKNTQFVKIYPNPASQQLNFEIILPDNLNQYELVILNSNSQELRREKASIAGTRFAMDVKDYASGTYYYSLASKSKIMQTGKFILTK